MTQIIPKKYSLAEINNIAFNGFICIIPPETMNLITELNNKVCSSSYVKTPVFNKRTNLPSSTKIISKPIINKKKKINITEVFNDDDWDLLNSFEVTKIDQKEGFENIIVNIRSQLNMLTQTNFIEKFNSITEIIDKLNEEEICKISHIIFDIVYSNKFYSDIYAKLYSQLISKYSLFMNTLNNKLEKYFDNFIINNIVDLNDYDVLCKLNKENEKIESFSLFIVQLVKYDILRYEYISLLIKELFNILFINIDNEEQKLLIDKVILNICILYDKVSLKNEYYKMNNEEILFQDLILNIIENVNKKKYKGLTNKSKSLFKLMDLLNI
jgi:hypothetical protein